MMKKFLLIPVPQVENLVQQNNLFKTTCKTKDKVCKVIIDNGGTGNLVSIEMVEKLEMEMIVHPTSFNVSSL
jgi:hypothetical protein